MRSRTGSTGGARLGKCRALAPENSCARRRAPRRRAGPRAARRARPLAGRAGPAERAARATARARWPRQATQTRRALLAPPAVAGLTAAASAAASACTAICTVAAATTHACHAHVCRAHVCHAHVCHDRVARERRSDHHRRRRWCRAVARRAGGRYGRRCGVGRCVRRRWRRRRRRTRAARPARALERVVGEVLRRGEVLRQLIDVLLRQLVDDLGGGAVQLARPVRWQRSPIAALEPGALPRPVEHLVAAAPEERLSPGRGELPALGRDRSGAGARTETEHASLIIFQIARQEAARHAVFSLRSLSQEFWTPDCGRPATGC